MMSIKPLSSSDQAVSYYEKDDYYQAEGGESDAQGQWWGEGAAKLGLSGGVDRDTFKDVLDGRLHAGVNLGTTRGGKFLHRPGWDLTFSAPKSVSVAAEVGGDKRVFAAHEKAVKAALGWIEKNSSAYRKRGFLGVSTRGSNNLVVALFQHDTSRNKDPQLHTHAVVANATLRDDGKWASLETRWFYKDQMAGGTLYRAALAAELQRLGYAIRQTDRDGRFEIAGVPDEVIKEFSTRREEIERSLLERGLDGAEASEQAALMTRSHKTVEDRAELRQEWKERAEDHGFDAARHVADATTAGDVTPGETVNVDRAVIDAISRLSETEAVFTRADLLRWVLSAAIGRVSIADAEGAIARAARNTRLFSARLDEREAWTTPQAKEQERRVLEAVQNGRDAVDPAMDKREATKRLRDSGLNEGQAAAATLIATTSDRIVGMLGRPGTGKTHTLGYARQLLEAKGYTLRGMAGNSEAARQLGQDSGIESGTLASHLTRVNRDINALKKADPKDAAELRERYGKEVWVVDEASQVSSGDMRRLTFAAERLGARIVLTGDPQQLPAISAGKPFTQMLRQGMKHVELDVLRRQQHDTHKAAVRAAIKGNITEAMQLLASDTRQIADRDQRLAAILGRWRSAENRDETLMLTARNVEKTALNDGARDILRAEGKLKDEVSQRQLFRVFSQRADREHAQFYQAGDVVLFGRGARALDIGRGAYLTVAGVDQQRNLVTLERTDADGRTERLDWNPRKIAGGAKRGVEIYRPRETTLAAGDRIQWNRNTRGGFKNGQVLTVAAVTAESMKLKTESGEVRDVATKEAAGQHWEHAYATTVYKSQGMTKQHVLVNAEASQKELMSQKAFLVAISRQKESITLFTDDTDKFTKNVEHRLGDKTSAQESIQDGRMARAASALEGLLADWRKAMTPDRPAERTPQPSR